MGCPQVLCFELLLVLVVFLELSVLVCPVLAYFLQNVLVCLVLVHLLVCVLVRVLVVCFAQTALVVCFSQTVVVAVVVAFLLGSIRMAALKKYKMLKIMLLFVFLPYLACHSFVDTEVLVEVFHTHGLEGGHLGR